MNPGKTFKQNICLQKAQNIMRNSKKKFVTSVA